MDKSFLYFGLPLGALVCIIGILGNLFVAGSNIDVMFSIFLAGCLTLWSAFFGHLTSQATFDENLSIGTGYLGVLHVLFGGMIYFHLVYLKLPSGNLLVLWTVVCVIAVAVFITALFSLLWLWFKQLPRQPS